MLESSQVQDNATSIHLDFPCCRINSEVFPYKQKEAGDRLQSHLVGKQLADNLDFPLETSGS